MEQSRADGRCGAWRGVGPALGPGLELNNLATYMLECTVEGMGAMPAGAVEPVLDYKPGPGRCWTCISTCFRGLHSKGFLHRLSQVKDVTIVGQCSARSARNS